MDAFLVVTPIPFVKNLALQKVHENPRRGRESSLDYVGNDFVVVVACSLDVFRWRERDI